MKTTVYPSMAGGFPPVSFFTFMDAIEFAAQPARTAECGVCTCPAASFKVHWGEVQRWSTRLAATRST